MTIAKYQERIAPFAKEYVDYRMRHVEFVDNRKDELGLPAVIVLGPSIVFHDKLTGLQLEVGRYIKLKRRHEGMIGRFLKLRSDTGMEFNEEGESKILLKILNQSTNAYDSYREFLLEQASL